jgi:hypothetical protein
VKGTVVMRFVGNRQEPEDSLRSESDFLWPSEVAKEINEAYEYMFRRMMEGTKIPSSLLLSEEKV